MHTLYMGPSWAVQSFETEAGLDDPVKTNLAQELNLQNYTSLARFANSNFLQLKWAKEFMHNHPDLAPFRMIFVTANSLQDGYLSLDMSQIDFVRMFLTSNDTLDIVKSSEQRFYHELDQLGIPVALIGAHTDVGCSSHNNITVIHPSWQNFLGQQCRCEPFYGWAADIPHQWLNGIVIPKVGPPIEFDLGSKPSASAVDEVHKLIFNVWRRLEYANLFKGVHPNILGNQLFAKEIADPLNKWIDNVV
jgi:hypothetical protein